MKSATTSFCEITHLTFDCYGTLIDWESGILNAVLPLLRRNKSVPDAAAILRSFVSHEARLESSAWQPYREVLRGVLEGLAEDFGVPLNDAERYALADSLPDWAPFPDTVAALRRLKERFQLIIVSNIDDALFAGTARRLEVPFDEIVTAEQVQSYKPAEAHFQETLRRLRVPPARVLHVAQSLYHDHVPAKRLGIRTAHLNHPSHLSGTGLAPAAEATPDWSGTDLKSLTTALGA